jgi:hypothetical protein
MRHRVPGWNKIFSYDREAAEFPDRFDSNIPMFP